MIHLRSLTVRAACATALFTALVVLLLGSASADTTLELKNDFIEAFKNRATIEVTFAAKFAHSKPKKPSTKLSPLIGNFTAPTFIRISPP